MASIIGSTFLLPNANNPTLHLCVIVCAERIDSGEADDILVVPITDRRNHPDHTVVLTAGEHPFITKDSIAFFKEASIISMQNILSKGYTQHKPATEEVINRIRVGVTASRFTPIYVKEWFVKHSR